MCGILYTLKGLHTVTPLHWHTVMPCYPPMSKKQCIIPHCDKEREGRGLCSGHYQVAMRLVAKGKTSWQLLEQNKQALPSREYTSSTFATH